MAYPVAVQVPESIVCGLQLPASCSDVPAL